MRVALVVFGSLDQPSGGYLYDRYLTEGLRQAGHEVEIVSQPPGLSYREQCRLGRGVRRTALGSARPGEPAAGIIQTITDIAPDLLIVDELNHAAVSPWLPHLQAALPSLVTVGLVHHLRSDEVGTARLARRRERGFLRRCDGWICNSGPTLARVRRVSGAERSSAVVHPGGETAGYGGGTDGEPAGTAGPPPQGEPLGTAGHPPQGDPLETAGPPPQGESATEGPPSQGEPALRLLSVGSVIPRKNLHLLIRAVKAFPGVALSIVGDATVDPRYTARLRREIAAAHLADRVVMRGRLSPGRLEEEYRSAGVMALPSQHEGFGIVFLEALARGVPVIAPRRGGVLDIVTPGVEGFLVRPGSVRAIRRVLREILADPRRIAGMRTAARRRATRFHSWSRTMAGAVSFLEVVARRDTPR
jgi:glycosyltransferase involved in cell wall biosynthesis